jgi:hypothetical protein
MCHRDIQNQRARRETIVFSAWQDHTVLHLYVSSFISCSGTEFMFIITDKARVRRGGR